jgi:hypothetical protein
MKSCASPEGVELRQPSAWKRSSRKFAPRNSHIAYKDSPFGGCAYYLMLATVVVFYNAGGASPRVSPLGKEVARCVND